jgi:hypothetical protein
MKTKYASMFGVVAALLLVASFIIPTNLATPSPVQAGVCKWDIVDMPGSVAARSDILTTSEPTKLAVGSDGATILAIVNYNHPSVGVTLSMLYASNFMGLMWSPTAYFNLIGDANATAFTPNLFDVAIAPDDPAFWAVVTGHSAASPQEVWITENAGGKWERTRLVDATGAAGYTGPTTVGAIDISVDYGGKRDIAVGMREGAAAVSLSIFVLQSQGFTGWQLQVNRPPHTAPPAAQSGDVFAMMFSPTYPADGGLAVVFTMANGAAVDNGTWYNIALRDVDNNTINQWVFPNNVEVGLPAAPVSPTAAQLITADIDLPSDFNGQAASLRRAYICTDANNGAGPDDGIFRMDNSTVYVLMDTTNDTFRRIATITYFGTYASGKLLAGSVDGYSCSASVPTWFTDSPTTCPVPCWYDCLKCPTGAGVAAACTISTVSPGNAQVAWFQGGDLALALTGTYTLTAGNATGWWVPLIVAAPVANDETALSISRNNGETWNQIALIDTTVNLFNDFAISADCTTLYVASASNASAGPFACNRFDSVWRSSINPAVVAPLPPIPPVGGWYERVYTRPTALTCEDVQSDLPLLRLVPGCTEPTGQLVGWAAQGTQAQAWSPDYGDYWANITARNNIQDFAFESSTILYNLYTDSTVHKLPYTGTSWGTTLPSVNPGFPLGHMITAVPEGQVLVGYNSTFSPYPIAISKDGGAHFAPLLQPLVAGNIHVAFDPAYADNNIIYAAAEGGSVYRQNVAGSPLVDRWADLDMLAAINGSIGCPVGLAHGGLFGIALAYTGGALYVADGTAAAPPAAAGGVWRTLNPLSGIPKPGIIWDQIYTGLTAGVVFTRQPYSLKLCGCCTLDTDTNLYALDARAYVPRTTGHLWAFTDCLAKKGPALITEDKMLIGCDPVSGRAQEVNLCWEQLCVARGYDIEIAKSAEFTIKVIDWVSEAVCANFLVPAALTAPCVYFPAGGSAEAFAVLLPAMPMGSAIAAFGNLECGHTYYWRVKVRQCVTGEIIRSPWSEVRSFTVKAGLPVTTPYYGPQLLAPNNGCLGCPVSPASFSWSPFKETSKYKFVLATDAEMTQVVKEAEVTTTAYEYSGTLNYSTNYFWRVMSLEPAPSDWSATFSFQTEAAPAPVTPEKPAPTPVWVWVVIAIGAILVIVTLVLIFKTRRV